MTDPAVNPFAGCRSAAEVLAALERAGIERVQIGIFDVDAILRWKKVGRKKFEKLLTGGYSFCDVLYVEELIGPNTVNTVPAATVDAFRDHGRARASLEEDLEGAQDVLAALPAVGVDLDAITAELLTAGVQAFVDAYARLLEAVEQKRLQQVGG